MTHLSWVDDRDMACSDCGESECRCYDEPDEPDYDALDREAERWTCIGPDCCNPHPVHMRDECFTAEMMEDWYAQMEQEDGQAASRGS